MHRICFQAARGGAAIILLSISLIAWAAPPGTLDQARALADSERYDEAVKVLDGLLSEQPDNVEAGLLRGVLLTRLARTDEAITAFTDLARRHPELPEPHNNLAVLYASQQRYEAARAALLRAIKLQPRYPTAYENLGDIYVQLAVAAYRRAAMLDPSNAVVRGKARRIGSLNAPPSAATVTSAAHTVPADAEAADGGPAGKPESGAGAEAAPVSLPANGSDDTAASATEVCYAFDGFAREADARRAAARLDARTVIKPRPRQVLLNFKVYLPPLANRRAADARIRSMRAAGIRDLVRIPRGDLTNGIALGVYGSEGAARRRVSELHRAGYDARFEPRYATRDGYRVEARYTGSEAPKSTAFDGFPAPATTCD